MKLQGELFKMAYKESWISAIEDDLAHGYIRNNIEHRSAESPWGFVDPFDRIRDTSHAAGCDRQDSTRSVW